MDKNIKIDGNKYKNCICWKNVAGYGEGCRDGYCSYEQRMACREQQVHDGGANNLIEKNPILTKAV